MKTLNILLVEDDNGDAKAVRRALEKCEIANLMHRAHDGIDALDMLRGTNGQEKIPPPHLLLVDINMPRMDGLTLIKELRKDPALNKTIVFLLTTSKREQDIEAAYNMHVAGYIVKETLGRDFENLAQLINYYRLIVEFPC